jgi:GGDEF domain-containing protein
MPGNGRPSSPSPPSPPPIDEATRVTSDADANGRRRIPRAPPVALPERIDGDPAFAARADRLLAECRRWRLSMAVLRIELLPAADDALVSAALLEELANRVRARLRATDGVFRLDDAHVGALLADVGEGTVASIVARLHRGLVEPYRLAHAFVERPVVRIGCAVCPLDGQTGVSLVRAAGRAR